MKLIKGKKISQKILADIKNKLANSEKKPGLAVILVGQNKASEIYVGLKEKAAQKAGINFFLFRFKKNVAEEKIIEKIKKLNKDEEISGIIVQLPLPENFNQQKIIASIDPQKDADGFHSRNIKKFINENSVVEPVFPKAILKMIESVDVDWGDKQVSVICNSEKFGQVMLAGLQKRGLIGKYFLKEKLSNNDKKTLNFIKQSDVLISACGVKNLVRGGILKKGVIVIDGGIVKKGKQVFGDIDFESCKKVAAHISPVPGGVGPVTVACLLENVMVLSKK